MGWSQGRGFGDPDEEAVFEAMHAGEPYTEGELAEQFPELSRELIRARLRRLVEKDKIVAVRHSGRRVTYYIPSQGMARPRRDV